MTTLVAAAAAAGLAGGVLAQTAAPAAPAPAAAQVPAAAQAQPVFDLSQLPATHGTVRFFTLTPRGDVDGFVLANGTEVHLPPHLSAQLAAAVKVGDAVTVRGLRAAAVPMIAAMAVTGDANGQTVVDNGPDGRRPGPGRGPDRGPGAPPAPAAVGEVSGKVLIALHGPRGELNGAMLEDGTALRLPPPEAARLSAMLQPGQTVAAQEPAVTSTLGRVVMVRGIGATRDALQQVQAPPPRGPRPGCRACAKPVEQPRFPLSLRERAGVREAARAVPDPRQIGSCAGRGCACRSPHPNPLPEGEGARAALVSSRCT